MHEFQGNPTPPNLKFSANNSKYVYTSTCIIQYMSIKSHHTVTNNLSSTVSIV